MSILAASTASSPISRFRRRRYRRRRRGHTVEPPACPTRWTCHCVAPECVRPTRATVFRPIRPRFLPACADRHRQHSESRARGFRRSRRPGSRVGCGYTSRTSSNAHSRSDPSSVSGSSSRHTTRRDPPGVCLPSAAGRGRSGSTRLDRLVDGGSRRARAETAAMGCAPARARTSRR